MTEERRTDGESPAVEDVVQRRSADPEVPGHAAAGGGEEGANAPSSPPGPAAANPPRTTGHGGVGWPTTTGESGGGPAGPGEEAPGPADELVLTRMELAERTADLQRLQAEFVNYKRRVERDRELIRENATYAALVPIIEVLDTIDRAREHGDLDPGFQAVAEQLERTVAQLGMTKFGKVGDVFDPTIHDALSHIGEDPSVAVTTCKVIVRAGYRIGDRVVRAAQVMVVDPPSEPVPQPSSAQSPSADNPSAQDPAAQQTTGQEASE